MKKFGIRKVKTWNGIKWGIVNIFTKAVYNVDKSGNKKLKFKTSEIDMVEYKVKDNDIRVGLFSYDSEGFEQAKKLQFALNK